MGQLNSYWGVRESSVEVVLAKRKEMAMFDRIISRSPAKVGGASVDTAGT